MDRNSYLNLFVRPSYRARLTILSPPMSDERRGDFYDVSSFHNPTTFALLGICKRQDTGVLRWLRRWYSAMHQYYSRQSNGGFAVTCITILHDVFKAGRAAGTRL
jgi:hypothetical protein